MASSVRMDGHDVTTATGNVSEKYSNMAAAQWSRRTLNVSRPCLRLFSVLHSSPYIPKSPYKPLRECSIDTRPIPWRRPYFYAIMHRSASSHLNGFENTWYVLSMSILIRLCSLIFSCFCIVCFFHQVRHKFVTKLHGRSKLDIKLDGAIFIIIILVIVSRLLLILLHPDSDWSRFVVSEVIVTDQ